MLVTAPISLFAVRAGIIDNYFRQNLLKISPDMSKISVGEHSCAMNSRLKAAPTITLSEREMLGFGWVGT